MYKVYIETYGAGLIYESDMELFSFFEKEGKCIDFPGLKIFQSIPKDCLYKVVYYNSLDKNINCLDKIIEINYPIDELTPASIAYMGYILMEKQRAEKSMVTVHSACVEKSDSGILILGRSGSGKTTTALNLCIENNYSLIGNDRNIIGLNNDNTLMAYEGTKFVFLRYESVKRNLEHLLHFFPEKNIDSWLRKTKVMPEDLNIKQTSIPVEINKSYLVHIDNEQSELYVSGGDTPANRLYLNETLSMYIRGIYTTFSDKNFHANGYIPSYDNELYYQNRVNIIDNIINNTNLEYVSGNINAVSNYIDENNKKLVYNNMKR